MLGLPHIVSEYSYAVLDIETTGLSKKTDQIVQISVSQVDQGRPRWRTYATVCPDIPSHPQAEAVHGLTAAALAHSPKFADLAKEIVEIVGSRVLLGYNIRKFDYPILQRQLGEAGITFEAPLLDVFQVVKQLTDIPTKIDLDSVAAYLGVAIPGQRHDAFHDCRLTWASFMKLAVNYPTFGGMTLDELNGVLK